jgi:uncharacterized SAM-binding protein YcdF (DUF218 family)
VVRRDEKTRGLRRRRIALAVSACLLVAGAWSAGLITFADRIPERVADRETRTDAIVVLTGGSERLTTGLGLLAEGRAKRVFVSGVHPAVDIGALLRQSGRQRGDLVSRIDTGHGARDTAGNASETADWMRGHGYRSLRLVTGGYHMPRSLLELGWAMPEAVVIPHPVFPKHVRQNDWWQAPGTTALIISEYNKYLLACVKHGAGRLRHRIGA